MDKSMQKPTICLNMIVKNESKIIKRLLTSVLPIIDCFCICDTGSTDNTTDLIYEFQKENNIPGKICHKPFVDFGYNRSFSLKECDSDMDFFINDVTGEKCGPDFILLLDADMVLELSISPDKFKQMIVDTNNDHYYIKQGNDAFFYNNTRLVRCRHNFSYWGVTHEFVVRPPGCTQGTIDKKIAFIRDIGDGGAKADKFPRDIRLLLQGLIDEPNNARYTFYLANSYKNNKDIAKAIEYYEKRTLLKDYTEEIWCSFNYMAECWIELGNKELAIAAWMNAYNAFPYRMENLHRICEIYRIANKPNLAYLMYTIADKIRKENPTENLLFMKKDVYDYYLDYEFSIIGGYVNPEKISMDIFCMELMAHKNIPQHMMNSVLSNYKFYAKPIFADKNGNMSPLHIAKSAWPDAEGFVESTPSICYDHARFSALVCIRFVNYTIMPDGSYSNPGKIITRNRMTLLKRDSLNASCHWKIIKQGELNYDTNHDGPVYFGLEDVKLFTNSENGVEYTANRGIPDGRIVVEHGHIYMPFHTKSDNPTFVTRNSRIITETSLKRCEKNWVLSPPSPPTLIYNECNCVYSWSPFRLGKIVNDQFLDVITTPMMPSFMKNVRGSCNGITVNDDVFFLCHVVDTSSNKRYYYHIIIKMTCDGVLKSYTPFFTFFGTGVEYALGFVFDNDNQQFTIGFSTNDNTTHIREISYATIEKMFIPF